MKFNTTVILLLFSCTLLLGQSSKRCSKEIEKAFGANFFSCELLRVSSIADSTILKYKRLKQGELLNFITDSLTVISTADTVLFINTSTKTISVVAQEKLPFNFDDITKAESKEAVSLTKQGDSAFYQFTLTNQVNVKGVFVQKKLVAFSVSTSNQSVHMLNIKYQKKHNQKLIGLQNVFFANLKLRPLFQNYTLINNQF